VGLVVFLIFCAGDQAGDPAASLDHSRGRSGDQVFPSAFPPGLIGNELSIIPYGPCRTIAHPGPSCSSAVCRRSCSVSPRMLPTNIAVPRTFRGLPGFIVQGQLFQSHPRAWPRRCRPGVYRGGNDRASNSCSIGFGASFLRHAPVRASRSDQFWRLTSQVIAWILSFGTLRARLPPPGARRHHFPVPEYLATVISPELRPEQEQLSVLALSISSAKKTRSG